MSAKRALITGITGQDGAYLAQLLLGKGYEVFGAMRRNSQPETARLDKLGITRDVELVDFDLVEVNNIIRIVRAVEPDEVYNLAAQSFVGSSWDQPVYVGDANALGVTRLLDTVRTWAPEARFYQASTSEMFGRVRTVPQNEETPFHPRSPYGVAKTYGHYMTINYRESYGLHASSGILFNHESPLRGVEFVTRKITLGLARIKLGDPTPLELGNLDAERDWGFARDYVEGMWHMLQQDAGDDYVLATGESTPLRDFVKFAANALDIAHEWQGEGLDEKCIDTSTGSVIVQVNERFYRPAEVDRLVGDASKAAAAFGWKPKVRTRELAEMMAKADFDELRRSQAG